MNNGLVLNKFIWGCILLIFSLGCYASKNDTIVDSKFSENEIILIFKNYYQNKFQSSYIYYEKVTSIIEGQIAVINIYYYGYDKQVHSGQLLCNKRVAKELTQIFKELLDIKFPIYQVKPINHFNFDDNESMMSNNTTCFDFRNAVNSRKLSNHAYGLAIDINPIQNPYIKAKQILPVNAQVDDTEGRIRHSDRLGSKAIEIFRKYGWTWGGNWNSLKDYMHFERIFR